MSLISQSLIQEVPFILLITMVFCVAHFLLKKFLSLPDLIENQKDMKKKNIEANMYFAYYLSFCHSTPLIIAGIYSFIFEEFNANRENKRYENMVMAYSLSFFIADTINGIIYQFNDRWMLLHHLALLICLTSTIATNSFGAMTLGGFLLGELTNPLLSMNKIFEKNSKRKQLTFYAGFSFCIAFLIIRGIILPHVSSVFFPIKTSLFFKFTFAFQCILIRVHFSILVFYHCQFFDKRNLRGKFISKRRLGYS